MCFATLFVQWPMVLLTGSAAILHLLAPTIFLQVVAVTTSHASRQFSVAFVLLSGVFGVVFLTRPFSDAATTNVFVASSRVT